MNRDHHAEIPLGAFKRQVQTGMNHAADMLSKFLRPGFRFRMEALQEEAAAVSSDSGQAKVGVCLQVEGAVTGLILLLFANAAARQMAGLLLRKSPAEEIDDGTVHSALNEVGNIFASGILFSLDDSLKLRALPSPPTFLSGTREQIQDQCRSCCNEPGDVLEQVELICDSPEGELFKGSVVFRLAEKSRQHFADAEKTDIK